MSTDIASNTVKALDEYGADFGTVRTYGAPGCTAWRFVRFPADDGGQIEVQYDLAGGETTRVRRGTAFGWILFEATFSAATPASIVIDTIRAAACWVDE